MTLVSLIQLLGLNQRIEIFSSFIIGICGVSPQDSVCQQASTSEMLSTRRVRRATESNEAVDEQAAKSRFSVRCEPGYTTRRASRQIGNEVQYSAVVYILGQHPAAGWCILMTDESAPRHMVMSDMVLPVFHHIEPFQEVGTQ